MVVFHPAYVPPPLKFVSQKIRGFWREFWALLILRGWRPSGPVLLGQFWWWALNQTVHSHEFSPVSSLGSQVAQM